MMAKQTLYGHMLDLAKRDGQATILPVEELVKNTTRINFSLPVDYFHRSEIAVLWMLMREYYKTD